MHRIVLVVGCLLMIVGTAWWVYQVTLLDTTARTNASGYGQFVIAAVGLVIVAGGWMSKAFVPAESDSLDEQADLLARAMRAQWNGAAADRRLIEPAPLPIRWRRTDLPVTGPVAGATRQTWFEPLPGLSRVTSSRLREGSRRTLHSVYGGLGSGRLILIGPPGAGKSAAAILLLLDALRFREQVEDRSKVPVPVMFTLHGWDPSTVGVDDWIVAKLGEVPMFRGQDGAARARRLLDANRISVFLDGLDEMAGERRVSALRALSEQATFRLVLLTRSAELVDATRHAHILGAAALELSPIARTDAADYLLRTLVSPAPRGWQAVADHLLGTAGSPLATALDNPLMLTLLRDVYPPSGRVDELLDTARFSTREEIENHLLDLALPSAYAPLNGTPTPAHSLASAERALGYIAHQLNEAGTRDLALWRIPDWTPLLGRMAVSVLMGTLLMFVTAMVTLAPKPVDTWWWATVMVGLMSSSVVATDLEPHRLKTPRWREMLRASLGRSAYVGTAVAVGLGTSSTLFAVLNDRPNALLYGAVIGGGGGLATFLAFTFAAQAAHSDPLDPVSAQRQDTIAWLVKSVFSGLALGLAVTVGGDVLVSHRDELPIDLRLGLTIFIGIGIAFTWQWRMFVARVTHLLRFRRRMPLPPRLLRFLGDAHARRVLRTIGPVYQFRHAKLQDRLAERYAQR